MQSFQKTCWFRYGGGKASPPTQPTGFSFTTCPNAPHPQTQPVRPSLAARTTSLPPADSRTRARFDVATSPSLASDLKSHLIRLAGKRVNADGILVLEAKRFRTQEANREDALAKFHEMICKAGEKPKLHRKTKPTKASKEERLKGKRKQAEVKKLRRGKINDHVWKT